MDTEKPTEPHYPPYCPPFYLVKCFEPAADDFIVAGIFSLAVDAERHQAHLNAQPRHAGSAHIQRLTMDQIITLLVRDRIRELAGAIDRLCGVGAIAGGPGASA